MLIRFRAENFLSFHEPIEFNMLTKDVRRHPNHVFQFPKIEVLKSAVIYGANGAGKSNLLMGIDALSSAVTQGSIDFFNDTFRFRLTDQRSASLLSIDFITNDVGFSYTLSFYDGIIISESLFILNFGKKENELVFERNKIDDRISLNVAARYLKTQKDKLLIQLYEEDLLTDSVPFLSLVKEKKYEEINIAYRWLEKGLVTIFPGMQYAGLVYNFINDLNFKEYTNRIIKSFDTGIIELDVQTLEFDQYFGVDNVSEKERVLKLVRSGETERVGENKSALAMMEDGKPVIKKAISYHQSINGEAVKFELFEESDGTLRVIDFIPILYIIENYPVTVLIDEIDQSIHPVLLKEFITLFQDNPNKLGQLIFTTHEANLLDQDLFRQDEIWFAEKGTDGASHFYPLSNFNVRPDLDVRKGYLTGKFGAIPFIADLQKLLPDTED